MEKNNLLESVRDIIGMLFNGGLKSCYQEIIYLFENYSDKDELQYIIFALEEIKETTPILNLKIKNYKLNKIISVIDTPYFLIPRNDGFIHIDALEPMKSYFTLPESLIPLIIIDNIPKKNADIFKLATIKNIDNKKYINYRTFEIDPTGRVLKLLKEEDIFSADIQTSQEIYAGILGDILVNLEKEITLNDL